MGALTRGALAVGRRSGAWRAAAGWYGRRRLTVLAYHRIADATAPGFVGYPGNASATPAEFEAQMAWIARHFTPVAMGDVAAALDGAGLPPRPVLVTFDDGYRDNLTVALPILRRHGIPATVFLATDHIGGDPFWWDRAAWCLGALPPGRVELPLLGEVDVGADRARFIRHWIQAAKTLPDESMRAAVAALPAPGAIAAAFAGVNLDWEDVASLLAGGVDLGAHTCRHPILARISAAEVTTEVSGSVQRVAAALGRVPLAFAYPNGQPGDFDDVAEAAVRAAGIRLAFTLQPGPARWGEVTRRPLRVRRVYVHHGDGVDRLAAKVAGGARLVRALG